VDADENGTVDFGEFLRMVVANAEAPESSNFHSVLSQVTESTPFQASRGTAVGGSSPSSPAPFSFTPGPTPGPGAARRVSFSPSITPGGGPGGGPGGSGCGGGAKKSESGALGAWGLMQSPSDAASQFASSAGISSLTARPEAKRSPLARSEGKAASPLSRAEGKGLPPPARAEGKALSPPPRAEGKGLPPPARAEGKALSPPPRAEGKALSPQAQPEQKLEQKRTAQGAAAVSPRAGAGSALAPGSGGGGGGGGHGGGHGGTGRGLSLQLSGASRNTFGQSAKFGPGGALGGGASSSLRNRKAPVSPMFALLPPAAAAPEPLGITPGTSPAAATQATSAAQAPPRADKALEAAVSDLPAVNPFRARAMVAPEDLALTEAQVERYRQLFSFFDADGSGAIDGGEVRDVLVKIGEPVTKQRLAALMSEVDADSSGDIDFGEFCRVMAKARGRKGASAFATAAEKVDKKITPLQVRRTARGCLLAVACFVFGARHGAFPLFYGNEPSAVGAHDLCLGFIVVLLLYFCLFLFLYLFLFFISCANASRGPTGRGRGFPDPGRGARAGQAGQEGGHVLDGGTGGRPRARWDPPVLSLAGAL